MSAPGRLESYRAIAQEHPELWESLPKESQNVDEFDFAILMASYPHFETIFRSDTLVRLWATALSRIPEIQEEAPPDESRVEWPYRQQTYMCLAKRAVALLSSEKELLKPFVKVCKTADLFFRTTSPLLAFLFRGMRSVQDLHPLQWAPSPHDGKNLRIAPPKPEVDWPRDYCGSWDHTLSIVRGILAGVDAEVKKFNGVRENLSFGKWLSRLDWGHLADSLKGFIRGVESTFKGAGQCRSRSSEVYSAYFSDTELSPVVDPNNLASTRALIQAGVDPLAVFDTSEISTQKPTRWKRGDASPEYMTLLELACSFGKEEILEDLLAIDRDCVRKFYAMKRPGPTLYERACMNPHPSVLKHLLQEEPVTLEIAAFERKGAESKLLPFLARFAGYREWVRHPQNHLLLACATGDIQLAEALIKKEIERARNLPVGSSEEARNAAAALAVRDFVNRPGDRFAPRGTPVEVAQQFNQAGMVEFLRRHGGGAGANLEMQIEQTRWVAGMVVNVVGDWAQTQQQISARLQELNFELSRQQLYDLTSIGMAYSQVVVEEQRRLESCAELLQDNLAVIDRINQRLDVALAARNFDPIIQEYAVTHGLVSSSASSA
ncbi:MAG: hypothetical protein JSS32_00035 [Verrucomicrobia bacterium]|nr:hypothetical protein [Verrucomicrobiota bacterium]